MFSKGVSHLFFQKFSGKFWEMGSFCVSEMMDLTKKKVEICGSMDICHS